MVSKQRLSCVAVGLVCLGVTACAVDEEEETLSEAESPLLEDYIDELPNNFPFLNSEGIDASYSIQTAPVIAMDNHFFTAQGTNGRSCGTCHAVEDGWSLNGDTATLMFLLTAGTHPLFANNLDTDTPTCDMTTLQSRWGCTTMLRQGLFTRSFNVAATWDFNVVAVNDPFAVSTTSRLWFFRRVMPTANFKSVTVSWDGANTQATLRDGLIRQARGNVTGAQQGPAAPDAVIFDIADYELGIGHAQTHVHGAGSLTAQGAKGGPQHAAEQPLVNARFDLFDAWQNVGNKHRRQIYRGQEIFNNVNVASGRTCRGCHNAANNGQNVNGTLFDIGASRPEFAAQNIDGSPRAVFTLQHKTTGEIRVTTDPGRAVRSGRLADADRFKTSNIRGLAARAPYFHNGIAKDLPAVVKHYEVALGFNFTAQEEDDLVAFLSAL